jgi:hypothetical protein
VRQRPVSGRDIVSPRAEVTIERLDGETNDWFNW